MLYPSIRMCLQRYVLHLKDMGNISPFYLFKDGVLRVTYMRQQSFMHTGVHIDSLFIPIKLYKNKRMLRLIPNHALRTKNQKCTYILRPTSGAIECVFRTEHCFLILITRTCRRNSAPNQGCTEWEGVDSWALRAP